MCMLHPLRMLCSNVCSMVQIYLMDFYIWYTLLSAIIGGVIGARARLGEVLSTLNSCNFSVPHMCNSRSLFVLFIIKHIVSVSL